MVAKTEVSINNQKLFKKVLTELLVDACKPNSADDYTATDMSVKGSPDRRQASKCWDFNHGVCKKGGPGASCGSAANKKFHLCDAKVCHN